MNNLTRKEAPDRSKINLHDPVQAKSWSHELGITRQRLKRLVEKVGNSAAAVRKELKD
jgi:DNA polymerase III delta subunit